MRGRKPLKTDNQSAGLPEKSKPASPLEQGYVVIGKIRRTHGVRGDVLFEVMTDFPERIFKGKVIYIGDTYTAHTVTQIRNHHVGMILHLQGYETPEDASVFRNQSVYVPIDDLPELPDGEIYHHELIGMRVMTPDGEFLGTLAEIMETGANDVLIIEAEDGSEMLLPDIESVVLGIDEEHDTILVQPPEWL